MVHIGEIYGKLTVIEDSGRRASNGGKYWNCKCSCGNFKEVRGDHLQDGHVKSCGCLNTYDKINNISGQTFNYLYVLEDSGKRRKSGDVIWKCKCKCGNITYASASELRNNRVKSCGCLRSVGELNIRNILNQYNIKYKQEYVFQNLKDIGNLRFDFAIFENNILKYLIEFDGEFHYNKGTWTKYCNSETLKKHDLLKNEYCKNNDIPLIRIPYWKRDSIKIEDLQLESSKYRLV